MLWLLIRDINLVRSNLITNLCNKKSKKFNLELHELAFLRRDVLFTFLQSSQNYLHMREMTFPVLAKNEKIIHVHH